MFFAAAYASRACPHCGTEYTRTISASLFFFLILIGVGSAVLAPAMTTRMGTGVVTWGLALGACAALLVTVATATDALIRSQTPLPDECPRCGADMIRAGGRYDGMIPTVHDVLIAIGYAVAVWVLFGVLTP